jgi:hypothetical protein
MKPSRLNRPPRTHRVMISSIVQREPVVSQSWSFTTAGAVLILVFCTTFGIRYLMFRM